MLMHPESFDIPGVCCALGSKEEPTIKLIVFAVRVCIITEKLIAVLIQVVAFNVIIYALSVISMAANGESIPWKEVTLLHLAF